MTSACQARKLRPRQTFHSDDLNNWTDWQGRGKEKKVDIVSFQNAEKWLIQGHRPDVAVKDVLVFRIRSGKEPRRREFLS